LADCGRRPGPFFVRRDDDNTTSRIAEVLRPSLEATPVHRVRNSIDRSPLDRRVARERGDRLDVAVSAQHLAMVGANTVNGPGWDRSPSKPSERKRPTRVENW
jgi:hypothetical protein